MSSSVPRRSRFRTGSPGSSYRGTRSGLAARALSLAAVLFALTLTTVLSLLVAHGSAVAVTSSVLDLVVLAGAAVWWHRVFVRRARELEAALEGLLSTDLAAPGRDPAATARALRETAGTFAQTREQVDQLQRLRTLMSEVSSPSLAAEVGLAHLCRSVAADGGLLFLAREAEQTSWLAASVSLPAALVEGGVPGINRLLDEALLRDAPFLVDAADLTLSLELEGGFARASHAIVSPLKNDQDTIGVVVLLRAACTPFEERQMNVVQWLGTPLALRLEHAYRGAAPVDELNIARAIIETMPVAISLMDLEATPIFRNHQMTELLSLLGIDPGAVALAERTAQAASSLADQEKFLMLMREIWADPFDARTFELELQSGGVLQVHTSPLWAGRESPIARLVVCRDITAERALAQLKSDLVSTVSHEIRAPLSNIVGFVELLLNGTQPSEKRDDFLRIVHGEGLRLAKLLDDLLDLQRIEGGHFERRFEVADLRDIVRRGCEAFAYDSHRIELELSDEPVVISCDPDLLLRAVENLVSNAIKYSPGDRPIIVAVVRRDGAPNVVVTDSGVGIPRSQQTRIFERFFRADTGLDHEVKGSGLGLSLTKEIVEAHGGAVRCSSTVGSGSTFTIELPGSLQVAA